MTTTSPSLSTSVVPWRYAAGRLHLLDQRRLPKEEVFLDCESAAQTAEAIRSLAVRGAPLIGVAAAFGLAAEARRVLSRSPADFDAALEAGADRLAAARPTAVNLSGAVERIRRLVRATPLLTPLERTLLVEKEAEAVAEEDRLACLAIAERGAAWLEARWNLPPGVSATVLTHCNAGALATAGIGTALGVVRGLAARRPLVVFADETRPFFQGARLTAWELVRDGLAVTLLPDVAAAGTIASGAVAAVVVGADRIARNGDVANKVGTYGLALACRANGVPFVVAAPTSTLDPATPSGAHIPIERRSSEEVLELAPGVRVAPPGVSALYPAFDVTPAPLVDAIVTERGVSVPPHDVNLRELLPGV
ncbi:MAG TPA: S-methyl-5-thioribose-1-phosphate isomerase, partial [Thermoanaerobaculia bacterium]|nr:S-methyl-5-thioribose-1-phosphate isomerase [Thermoanaerobaculia bacterium]